MFLEVQTHSGTTYLVNTKNHTVSVSGNKSSIGNGFDGETYVSGSVVKGAPMLIKFPEKVLKTSAVEKILSMDHELVHMDGALEITASTETGSTYVFNERNMTVSGGVFGNMESKISDIPQINLREKMRINLANGQVITTSPVENVEYYRSREAVIDRPDISTAKELCTETIMEEVTF